MFGEGVKSARGASAILVAVTTIKRCLERPFTRPIVRTRKRTPHKRFSKMISLHTKNLESALLAEPHVAVMFSCRTLQIAEPKALNLEKDYLAEPWNAGSFRICSYCKRTIALETAETMQ